ncbi:hypothetical protein B296_00006473 [Ensete ventricosum]|uniref:2-oxoglutarate dehydrogenase, mitochondrial n=1 Tax=Ensete ventricosum TaxID=4639 RepID=A0A427AWS6_ENSVE|nr:hypothetical protein B296_00006473 [Ensete ventricosum]
MSWFRAVSGVARSAIRRNLSQAPHHIGRPRALSSPPSRGFHSTALRRKAESAAPIPRAVPLSRLTDSFLDGTSSVYLEELQRAWEADPNSVDESWDNFFRNFVGQAATSPGISGQTIQESMRLLLLVRAYQVNGHMKAKLDPLGLEEREIPEDLDLGLYGFTEADLDREFFLGVWRMAGFLSENRPVQTLREILNRLEQAYCGNVGYEYMHIPDRDKCNWIRDKIETVKPREYSRERREVILDRLIWSSEFENFLATKWTAAKRFGLEGGETLIPGMKEMFDRAADQGVESIVIGMSHRGRLNVLGNVVRKPLRQIFSEFSSGTKPVDGEVGLYTGTGDVKYHLGTSYDRPTRGGKRIHLSLVANPSHLEAVDPLVVGKTRAKQYYSNDIDRIKNMGVLIHGDGSFAGQGVVYETLHLSALPNYTTGGTIHIVINNQVAFTTDPRSGRSSQYCTDVAKALNAPIFHVNGDDMEAVVHVCELAAEWRQIFHSDVVVDIVCYRRFGHNEIDEPSFTQPKMYQVNHSLSFVFCFFLAQVKPEILKRVGQAITTLPETFKPHRAVKKIFEQRAQMIESGEGIDWAMGEALAFATLIIEGNHVRLSGQDVERGTFSHRHSVIHDQQTGEKYCPLDHIVMNQDEELFTVSNSEIIKFFRISVENPNGYAKLGLLFYFPMVTMVKAQNIQVLDWSMSDDNPYVIPEMDPTLRKQIQECNWQVVNIHREFRKPLIVIAPKNLLRHKDCKSNLSEFDDLEGHPGFDKQGTRFKRLIKDQNNHKEIEEGINRLILCSGKASHEILLSASMDNLISFFNGFFISEYSTYFHICFFQVYYELDEGRKKSDRQDVAICRVEQLCPFPYDLIQRELKRYPSMDFCF